MIGALHPRVTTFALAGVQRVNSVNNVLINGKVPFRVTGDVSELLARYPEITIKHQKIDLPDFHRYCSNVEVGRFDTDEHAERGLEVAEHRLRLNPGPGINLTQEIGSREQAGTIWVFHLNRLGPVNSHWDDVSRSVINETMPKHKYRTGFVIRQASLADRAVSVVTFGEGVNDGGTWYDPGWFLAWKNGNGGPAGFWECNAFVHDGLKSLPGFQETIFSQGDFF